MAARVSPPSGTSPRQATLLTLVFPRHGRTGQYLGKKLCRVDQAFLPTDFDPTSACSDGL